MKHFFLFCCSFCLYGEDTALVIIGCSQAHEKELCYNSKSMKLM